MYFSALKMNRKAGAKARLTLSYTQLIKLLFHRL